MLKGVVVPIMSHVAILKRETVYNERSRLERIQFEKEEKGQKNVYEKDLFFRPAAVAILLYDPERKTVILTRQFRLPVYLDKREELIETCAGLLDEGELPEHAVVREVEEETGYRISEIRKIAEGYSSPAAYSEYVHFFTGKYSPDLQISAGGGLKEEGESIEILEYTSDQIREQLQKGQIKDVKTILLLQHAMLNSLI